MRLIDNALWIEEQDIDYPQAIRGHRVDMVYWPISRKDNYRETTAWAIVCTMIENGSYAVFYKKAPWDDART